MKKNTLLKMLNLLVLLIILLPGCKKADNDPDSNADPLVDDYELPYTNEDWMSNLDDGITLGQITIPGTHDSGADKHSSQVSSPEWHYVICQDFGIPNQLKLSR